MLAFKRAILYTPSYSWQESDRTMKLFNEECFTVHTNYRVNTFDVSYITHFSKYKLSLCTSLYVIRSINEQNFLSHRKKSTIASVKMSRYLKYLWRCFEYLNLYMSIRRPTKRLFLQALRLVYDERNKFSIHSDWTEKLGAVRRKILVFPYASFRYL